jgi:two-component system, sensor histidine kinase
MLRASEHRGAAGRRPSQRVNPKDILRWSAFAAIYFAFHAIPGALYGDNPAMRGGNAVAVFVLLLAPRRHWLMLAPVLWLAAGAAREITHAAQPWLVGACNALEVIAVAAVLHGRHGLGSPWFGREQLLRLVLAAGGVPLLTAAAATAALPARADLPAGEQWLTWYLASALAYVFLLPVLLSWMNPELRSRALGTRLGWRAAAIALLAAGCVALLRQQFYAPLLLLSFPLVVLSTWWYRLPGATTVIAALAVAGGWLASRDVGALSLVLGPGASVAERVQALQLYLAAIVLCSLPFAVLLAEQEMLSGELRRKSDARAEFLAAMSHEIRTPMTGVLGMADLLAAQPLTAEQRRYVDAMRSSGRHLVNVINDILDFSRIETGKLTLETVDFQVTELIEQLRSLVHPMAQEKGLAFDVRLAAGAPDTVRGDPTRLRQILLNLAGNALKFTAHGSVGVEVSGLVDANGLAHYRFAVRDTGIGIPPDKLEHLFSPFTQADRSTVREYGGSGLGLAISRRLAEAMGGRIDVASTPGAGSVFTLEVPLEAGSPGHRRAAGASGLDAASPQRILVAEDVQVNRDILRLALGARGHQLVFAPDGATALAKVQQEPFDLVLMDVQMPVMDGVEATRRIRALPTAAARIPIIGLTANVMSQEQARYLEAGMDECLMKPIEWDLLDAAIARHASGALGEAPIAPIRTTGTPPRGEVPLLEEGQIASLRGIASDAEFRMLMDSGMETVERTVGEILGSGVDRAPLAAAAHRLKGSAGQIGLARISAVAGALEEACARGGEVEGFQQELAESLRQTRAALVRAGGLEA